MKHFIYTYSEKRLRGATIKTVRIYGVKKNDPVFMGQLSDTFVSEFQLVMQALESYHLLPPAAFERTASHSLRYGTAYDLREARIASITRVS